MNYVLWYSKCKSFRVSVSEDNNESVDLVRFVAWSGDEAIQSDRVVCSCHMCNSELSLILLRCPEHKLDAALDAEPLLIEKSRRTADCCDNAFVHYSFTHPSLLDRDALFRILSYTEVSFVYVTTTYNPATGVEDSSVFKINLVKHKTPGCDRDINWMAARISDSTNLTARKLELRYVTYFTPFTGNVSRRPISIGVGKYCCPGVSRSAESLHALLPPKKKRSRHEQ